MKKTLFVASLGLAMCGWAIELSPASISAATPLLVQQPASNLSAPAATNSQPPQVELLNPGVEPREQLRLKPAINVKETTVMTMKMDVRVSGGSRSSPVANIPVSVMTIETKVTKIDANGDIHYEYVCTNADIAGEPGNLPPAALNAIRSALKKMVGLKGYFIRDNRGFHKGGNFILPTGADRNFEEMVGQMSKSLEQLFSPLPAEPVGKGATWRVASSSKVKGVNVNNVATYELASWQDGVISMNLSINQQVNPATFSLPSMPDGSTLTIKSFASQGQGKVARRLDKLMPFRSNVAVISHTEMSSKRAGSSEELTTQMKMSVEMTSESK